MKTGYPVQAVAEALKIPPSRHTKWAPFAAGVFQYGYDTTDKAKWRHLDKGKYIHKTTVISI